MGINILPYDKCVKESIDSLLGMNNIIPQGSVPIQHNTVLGELNRFLTVNPAMLELKRRIIKVLNLDDPVLLVGPSGVGKEILARTLAAAREGDFIPINCAAVQDTLVESELFGHVKGAFTDAKESRVGVLVAAQGGTVLLDEIDRASLALQSKLLRAIETKEVRPVGSSKMMSISCRFIATAKHDIMEQVRDGRFLPDLYGRLTVFQFRITPLRERKEDIELIMTTPKSQGGLGLTREHYLNLPDDVKSLLDILNVRALIAYAKQIEVFGSWSP